MNFEELYGKYKNGTATDEEKQFIETEIIKARKISAILDEESYTTKENIFAPAEKDDFVKARKKFNTNSTIKTIIIVVCSVAILTGICLATVFGTAIHYASKLIKITDEEAIEYAKECVYQYDNTEHAKLIVDEIKMEIEIKTHLTKSEYVYEIELENDDTTYKIDVNANSGYATIINIYSDDKLYRHDYKKSEE